MHIEDFGELYKCSVCGCVSISRDGKTPDQYSLEVNEGQGCEEIVVRQVMKDLNGWQAFDHLEWSWGNGN
jgi:hypothetical protein